jgi:hypothetical protein
VRVVKLQAVEVCGVVVVAGHRRTDVGSNVIPAADVASPTNKSIVCAAPFGPDVVSGSAVGGVGGLTVGV